MAVPQEVTSRGLTSKVLETTRRLSQGKGSPKRNLERAPFRDVQTAKGEWERSAQPNLGGEGCPEYSL